MAIIPWGPLWPIDDELDRIMRRLTQMGTSQGFVPAIDVYQNDNEVIIESPVPGVDPKDVTISVENDVLTIEGSTEKKTEVDEKNYWRKEVRSGSFYRQIPLPARVIADKAEASYDNGVLKVVIPKLGETPKQKKIEIKTK